MTLVAGFAQRGSTLPGPGARGPVATASPWPLYPSNGTIPPEFANRHVFLDANGDALVLLTDETGNRKMFRRELENHVAGIVSSVTAGPSGTFTYEYNIQNRANARQSIVAFSIGTPTLDGDLTAPNNWGTSKVSIQPSRLNWFAKISEGSVRKGSAAFGFRVTSTNKPGLTFAYFQGLAGDTLPAGPPILNFEVPDEIQTELSPTTRIEFNSAVELTIGPKFPERATKQEIAADFHTGISRLINRGQLDAQSRWVSETLAQIANFIDVTGKGGTASIVIQQQPVTPLEREIANAMKFSLGLP